MAVFVNKSPATITIGHARCVFSIPTTIPPEAMGRTWAREYQAWVDGGKVGKGPGEPQEREARLLEGVRNSAAVRAGYLVEGSTKAEPGGQRPGIPDPLAKETAGLMALDSTSADAQVRMCKDLPSLRGWLIPETRHEIKKLIEARIRKLESEA